MFASRLFYALKHREGDRPAASKFNCSRCGDQRSRQKNLERLGESSPEPDFQKQHD